MSGLLSPLSELEEAPQTTLLDNSSHFARAILRLERAESKRFPDDSDTAEKSKSLRNFALARGTKKRPRGFSANTRA